MKQDRKKGKVGIKKWTVLFSFLCMNCIYYCMLLGVNTCAQEKDPVNDAKQGVVEVCSGFTGTEGTFYQMQHASGFVISNEDSRAYVITTRNTLQNTEKQIKKYCQKNDIKIDSSTSFQDTIKVVVKGDVTVDASILTESEKENYSILQVDSSISERVPLKLGAVESITIGESVYALGFSENAGEKEKDTDVHTEFSAMDVEIHEGKIQDTASKQAGILYLQHSVPLSEGNTGGPLLNADGYVVGLNDIVISEDNTVIYYSLPINEVREILDNFQINYESSDRDFAMIELEKRIKECTALIDNPEYKKDSKETLLTALEQAKTIAADAEEVPGQDEIKAAIAQLNEAKGKLQLKMKTTRKIIIVLLFLIGLLAGWLAKLLFWKKAARDDLSIGEMEKEHRENNVQKISVLPVASELSEEKKREPLRQNNAQMKKVSLRSQRTGQIFLIDCPEIHIGKKQEQNQCVITDNNAISRNHACIIWKEDRYYIIDKESANGTYVNGVRAVAGNWVPLKNGDNIMLADERFLFKVEE